MLPTRIRAHVLLLGLVVAVVYGAYHNLLGAYYCGYDDFNERHRAAFFDARDPTRILTTYHNTPFMYRPLTSGLQYVTWRISDTPEAYRVRNVSMHLVSVAMIYGIAFFLSGSLLVAAASGLLFGLDPLANQPVAVAVWTNTTACAFLFASFFLFLAALNAVDAKRRWVPAFALSMACALIAIFTYEGTIVVLAWMLGYLGLRRWQGRPVPRSLWISFASAGTAMLALFFAARHVVVKEAVPLAGPATAVRDLVAYLASLLMPVDPILANALFGAPLPSRSLAPSTLIVPAASAIVFGAVTCGILVRYRHRLAGVDLRLIALLALAILVSLAPLVLHRDHPTETDLYVSVGLYAIIVATFFWQVLRRRAVYAALIGALCVFFAVSTTVRNRHVIACGEIVSSILSQLPISRWESGTWHIRFATPPGETLTPRYGIYGLSGIETIEVKGSDTPGAQEAVQLATANSRVSVNVVQAAEMERDCTRAGTCFWIARSGVVREFSARR